MLAKLHVRSLRRLNLDGVRYDATFVITPLNFKFQIDLLSARTVP